MCSSEANYIFNPTVNDDAISVGGILLTDLSTTEAITSLGHTLNFIESWIQSFKKTFIQKIMI